MSEAENYRSVEAGSHTEDLLVLFFYVTTWGENVKIAVIMWGLNRKSWVQSHFSSEGGTRFLKL